jgi:hypothetical protein
MGRNFPHRDINGKNLSPVGKRGFGRGSIPIIVPPWGPIKLTRDYVFYTS